MGIWHFLMTKCRISGPSHQTLSFSKTLGWVVVAGAQGVQAHQSSRIRNRKTHACTTEPGRVWWHNHHNNNNHNQTTQNWANVCKESMWQPIRESISLLWSCTNSFVDLLPHISWAQQDRSRVRVPNMLVSNTKKHKIRIIIASSQIGVSCEDQTKSVTMWLSDQLSSSFAFRALKCNEAKKKTNPSTDA